MFSFLSNVAKIRTRFNFLEGVLDILMDQLDLYFGLHILPFITKFPASGVRRTDRRNVPLVFYCLRNNKKNPIKKRAAKAKK